MHLSDILSSALRLLVCSSVILFQACGGESNESNAAQIAVNGKPTAKVLWWSETNNSAPEFAASELQRYIASISGAELEVSRINLPAYPAPEGMIVVPLFQIGKEADQLQGRKYQLTDDGYAIDSRRGAIVIASREGRGVLYGVYDFLGELGARFFAPGYPFYHGQAEYLPKLVAVGISRKLRIENPSFAVRRKYISEGTSHTPSTITALIDWMAKNRLNTLVYPANLDGANFVQWDSWRDKLAPELLRRGLLLEVGGHGYDTFLKRSDNEAMHPEWFGNASEPVVGPGRPPANVFRISNAEALQQYSTNVLTYLLARPEIRIFDAWPPDGATWIKSDVDNFGGVPNTMSKVSCALQDIFERSSLQVRVASLGYLDALGPPNLGSCYSAQTSFDLAPYDRSYASSIDNVNSESNSKFAQVVDQWRKSNYATSLGVFEYYRKYSWHSLPVILPELMGRDFSYYHDQGIHAIGFQSEPADWITYELSHLLGAELAWHASTDVPTFVNGYLAARYGTAATSMGEYLKQVGAAGQELFDSATGRYGDPLALGEAISHYELAKDALKMAAAQTSSAVSLIELLSANADYAILDTKLAYSTVSGDQASIAILTASLKQAIESHNLDGIVLENYYSIKRYNPSIAYADTYWLYDMYRQAFQ